MPMYRMTVKTAFPGGALHGTNTWHIRTTTQPLPPAPTPPTNIKNFYTALQGLFGPSYKWTWDGTLVEVGNPAPALVAPFTAWSVAGNAAGLNDSGPGGVGLCVTWKSGLASKRGRGRTFIAPLPPGWYDSSGTINDSNLATIRAAAANLVSVSLADGNGAVAVYSAADNVARDVQSYNINDRVAFMSSRRGR